MPQLVNSPIHKNNFFGTRTQMHEPTNTQTGIKDPVWSSSSTGHHFPAVALVPRDCPAGKPPPARVQTMAAGGLPRCAPGRWQGPLQGLSPSAFRVVSVGWRPLHPTAFPCHRNLNMRLASPEPLPGCRGTCPAPSPRHQGLVRTRFLGEIRSSEDCQTTFFENCGSNGSQCHRA